MKTIQEYKDEYNVENGKLLNIKNNLSKATKEYDSLKIKKKDFNRISTFNNLVLTDGYTDTLNFTNIKGKTLILTTVVKPKIEDPKGVVRCIEIDLENSLHSS